MRIGRTALLRAAGEGRLQLVKLLLHHGADPAAVDNRGNTGAGEVSGQPLIAPMIMKHSDFVSNDVMAQRRRIVRCDVRSTRCSTSIINSIYQRKEAA